jgi:hypothetical protein
MIELIKQSYQYCAPSQTLDTIAGLLCSAGLNYIIDDYTNYFGSLEDIDIKNLDLIFSIVKPDINVEEYLRLHFKFYYEICCLVTGGLAS